MKFSGHTMGTPKLDIFGAIKLFSEIGYEGIEVRVKDDGQINADTYTPEFGAEIKTALKEHNLEMACLTPYYRNFVLPELRESELAGFIKVVDIAADLDCPIVRSYGGINVPEGMSEKECWSRTVSGIRKCAAYAAKQGIKIAIETHIGSLTFSATDTVRMVEDIGCDNVGVLFDFAWVDFIDKETPEGAIKLVAPYLFHCHVKDWIIHERIPPKKTSKLMGQGQLPWAKVLRLIADTGYQGYLTDEYEKYWYDYLPEPEIGMKHNLDFMKEILKLEEVVS